MNLKLTGIDTLRIPVGDWMYAPYEPFIGCMDGALDELRRVLKLCEKYDLKAVLDIHAMKGSQVATNLSASFLLLDNNFVHNGVLSIDLDHFVHLRSFAVTNVCFTRCYSFEAPPKFLLSTSVLERPGQ